jgi:fatty acid desaturase
MGDMILDALDGTRDHSATFGRLRPLVANSRGEALIDLVKTLTPHYAVVYRDIAIGYALLIGTLVGALAAEHLGAPRVVVGAVGAVSVGYWTAYLQLFIHEGAHWNLAADRERSDRLCNLLISWLAGLEVASYRRVHFQHHRALGTVADSENSYFFPLNLVFIAKGLFGVRALEVMLARREMVQKADERPGRRLHKELVIAAVVHGAIVVSLLGAGYWASAIAWGAGVGLVFPFFGALRQLLEHRAEDAQPQTDFRKIDHGAVSRMFGDGLVAGTFGGAGFNRHLLHHWEPGVSYTRLPDLERFLGDTPLRAVIERRTTTYGRVFRRLFAVGLAHAGR